MHIRRALLLFAIVLGLAALAASLSRPSDDEASRPAAQAPTTTPDSTPRAAPGDEPTEVVQTTETVELDAGGDETRRLEAGRPASVLVAVDEPGRVDIPLLGLTGAADPLTPARFDLLVSTPGRYPLEFTPAGSDEERSAGTLVVAADSG